MSVDDPHRPAVTVCAGYADLLPCTQEQRCRRAKLTEYYDGHLRGELKPGIRNASEVFIDVRAKLVDMVILGRDCFAVADGHQISDLPILLLDTYQHYQLAISHGVNRIGVSATGIGVDIAQVHVIPWQHVATAEGTQLS